MESSPRKLLLGYNVYNSGVQLLTEAFLFIVTEILIRLLFSKSLTQYVESQTRKVYTLTTQGVLLLIISVTMALLGRIPFALSLVTCFIFLRLLVLLLSQSTTKNDNTFVSSPLPFGNKSESTYDEQIDRLSYSGSENDVLNYQHSHVESSTSSVVHRRVTSNTQTSSRTSPTLAAAITEHRHQPFIPHQRAPTTLSTRQRSLPSRISQSLFCEHPSLGYLSSVLDFRRPNRSPPGLINSGNTCFINSTLQCLIWMPGFIDSVPVVSSFFNDQTAFIKNLNEVIYQCHVVPDGVSVFDPVSTMPLLKSVSTLATHLVSGAGGYQSQQDAAEFLLWFLNHLHTTIRDLGNGRSGLDAVFTEANKATLLKAKQTCLLKLEKLRSSELLHLQEPLVDLSEVDWQLYWQSRSSTLYKLFLGQLIEARECQECMKMSVNVEYFTLLPLPLPSSSGSDPTHSFELKDCFELFGEIEDLVQSNMISCSCISAGESILTPGKRLAMLSHLPPRLVIQLTRYSYSSELNAAIKNKVHIAVPVCMDLSSFTMRSKLSPNVRASPLMYELQALCLHSGSQSTSFGHYIAYCKAVNSIWYHFNDDVVSPVSDVETELSKRFVLENAYLLFYAVKT